MKEGWELKKLGEVCEETSNIKWSDNEDAEFKYIDLSSVSRELLEITSTTTIDAKNAPSRAKKIVKLFDVIFATTRPTLKRVTVISEDFHNQICSTGFTVLRPRREKVNEKYIAYFIQSDGFMDRMETLQRGASYPAVTDNDVKKTKIPIPPIDEQRAIVAILDEAFVAIDKARANIEKNIANANELFQSKLNEIFSQKGDGWEEKKLGDLVKFISTGPFGSLLHKSDYVSDGIPLVNPINMIDGKIVPDEEKQVTSETLSRLKNYWLLEGDVVVARRGEIGRCALVRKEENGWLCGTGSFFIRPNGTLLSEFIVHLFSSSLYKNKLESVSTGATMKNISNKALSDIFVICPSPKEQEKIIEKIDKLRTLGNELKKNYSQKLNELEELKKSLLQKAFAGELS